VEVRSLLHTVCSTSNNIGIVAGNDFLWLLNLWRLC